MLKSIYTTNKDLQVGHNQVKVIIASPVDITISTDKNMQICDMQPRVLSGIDLFSKYHGRTEDYVYDLVKEINDLNSMICG